MVEILFASSFSEPLGEVFIPGMFQFWVFLGYKVESVLKIKPITTAFLFGALKAR